MHDPQHVPPIFRIDVSADPSTTEHSVPDHDRVVVSLLRQILTAQERQNKLLEELTQQLSGAQRQRAAELGQWKEANPDLSRYCRLAAETLSRVQTQFLHTMTTEIV